MDDVEGEINKNQPSATLIHADGVLYHYLYISSFYLVSLSIYTTNEKKHKKHFCCMGSPEIFILFCFWYLLF